MAEVKYITITSSDEGQRIDNFLVKVLKGVPKSRIYRAITKGEVRVNKGRTKPTYRLKSEDIVRIPPIRTSDKRPVEKPSAALQSLITHSIIFEDDNFIVISKPCGMPVHGGTGANAGLIELLREMRPKSPFLELVHRLDKPTSGCLVIAKKRSALRACHELMRSNQVRKTYLLLVKGHCEQASQRVDVPLKKNVLNSGERIVKVDPMGKPSITVFKPLVAYKTATLMQARLVTGRTHQIRVHAAHIGHPIVGDEQYGDKEFNRLFKGLGLSRMFLHSAEVYFKLKEGQGMVGICAPLDRVLQEFLATLD